MCIRDREWIAYKNIPTYNKQVAQGAGVKNDKPFENWWSLYIKMCDGGRDWVSAVFRAFLGAEGCVIYNCTTGKDRTGIISLYLSDIGIMTNIRSRYSSHLAMDYLIRHRCV